MVVPVVVVPELRVLATLRGLMVDIELRGRCCVVIQDLSPTESPLQTLNSLLYHEKVDGGVSQAVLGYLVTEGRLLLYLYLSVVT